VKVISVEVVIVTSHMSETVRNKFKISGGSNDKLRRNFKCVVVDDLCDISRSARLRDTSNLSNLLAGFCFARSLGDS